MDIKRYFMIITVAAMISCATSHGKQSKSVSENSGRMENASQELESSSKLNDSTALIQYALFDEITVAIPSLAIAAERNSDAKVKGMGFAFFASKDEKIDITVRKMEVMPLEELKTMMDMMSVSMYQGDILRSELIKVNGIEIYVTDISGHWNGQDEKIGMFRYYFNMGESSFNLLMKYPFSAIKTSMKLKQQMIQSIVLKG